MPRNTNGTYTLPAGNPVVSGTLIQAGWANPTMADIAQSLTDSLDRNGRGSMLAAFKIADGLATAPGIGFGSESATGIYRPGSGVMAFSVLGVEALRMDATNVTVSKALVATGGGTLSGSFAGALTLTGDPIIFNGKVGIGGTPQQKLDINNGILAVRAGATMVGYFGQGTIAQASDPTALAIRSDNGPIIFTGAPGVLDMARWDTTSQTSWGQLRAQGWYGSLVSGLGAAAEMGVTGGEVYFGGFDRNASTYKVVNVHGLEVKTRISGAVAMWVNSSGNVGIGPGTGAGNSGFAGSLLDLWTTGTARMSFRAGAGGGASTEYAGNGNAITSSLAVGQDASGVGYVFQRANTELYFGTNNLVRMRINAAGDVGIGTTPSYALHVQRTNGYALATLEAVTSGSANLALVAATNTNTNGAGVFYYNTIATPLYSHGVNSGSAAINEWSIYSYLAARNIFTIKADGTMVDGSGGRELGWKDVPRAADMPAGGTLDATHRGKFIVATGGPINVNSGVMPAAGGAIVTISNLSAGAISIVPGGGFDLYWMSGTGDKRGTRALASFGCCTLLYTGSTGAIISGVGLS